MVYKLFIFIPAIDDLKVDKRIIEIAKQSYNKEKEKEKEDSKIASKKEMVRLCLFEYFTVF